MTSTETSADFSVFVNKIPTKDLVFQIQDESFVIFMSGDMQHFQQTKKQREELAFKIQKLPPFQIHENFCTCSLHTRWSASLIL